jgi:hypothetical protein
MAINNPVDSFMRGFAIVDQLETNRETRSFQRAQRSRMYEMWEREDEEYEKAKLRQYQQEKLVEFNYELDNVIQGIAAEVEQLKADKKFKEAELLENKWFTPNTFSDGEFRGVSLAVQEVVKKMQQRDPSFGEHVALAGGRDPGAGSLVDSKNPVANVFVVPPDASPNGQASVAFEVNRKDGKLGPMTVNRTESGNDPIDFIPVDTQLMFKVFGPGFADNKMAGTRLLGTMFEGDRGNPRAVEKEDATTAGGGSKEQPGGTAGSTTMSDEEFAARQAQADQEAAARSTPPPSPINVEGPDIGLSTTVPSEEERARSNTLRDRGQLQGDRGPAQDQTTTPIDVGGPAEEPTESRGIVGQFQDAATAIARRFGLAGEAIERGTEKRRAEAVETLQKIGHEVTVATTAPFGITHVDTPEGKAVPVVPQAVDTPEKAKQVGATPSTVTAAERGDQAAMDKITVPGNNEAVQRTAQVATGPVRGRKPSFIQRYNALSLARMGLVTPEELSRYARTGSWNEPAEWKLNMAANGQYVMWTSEGDMRTGFLPGAAEAANAEAASKARRDLLVDRGRALDLAEQQAAYYFEEDDERGFDAFMRGMEEVFEVTGMDDNSLPNLLGRSSSENVASIARSYRLVRMFDEDLAQNLLDGTGDFNPLPGSDMKLPVTGGNLAIGIVADKYGISTPENSAEFYRWYAGKLHAVDPYVDARRFVLSVEEHERTVLARYNAARDPKHSEHEYWKDKYGANPDRNAIRRDYVKEVIKNAGG